METEKYYLRHSSMPIEEDLTHEFKAHRELTLLDVSTSKYQRTNKGDFQVKPVRARAPLSKTICGMLNTGLESTIYLGVDDLGTVHGLMLSLYQKDHFMVALRDLMNRYDPPVPSDRISVKFVPVLDQDELTDSHIEKELISYEMSRSMDHQIRSNIYCWCDNYTYVHYIYLRNCDLI